MYDSGVGTNNGPVDRIFGDAFGYGIDNNIRDLYTVLALNYDGPDEEKKHEGDEIYMFGYSRGAYTVRSLAGMMERCGLVRRDQIQFVKEAYDLYRSEKNEKSAKYEEFQSKHGRTPPIKLIACFNTVGALGIPGDHVLAQKNNRAYNFHNTKLGYHIEHAIHMLAIDENRKGSYRTLMIMAMAMAMAMPLYSYGRLGSTFCLHDLLKLETH